MPIRQLLLGVLVTVVWGLNFSLIKVAEDLFQPFLLATLRFVLCCIPAIFFLPRPKIAWKYLLAYGLVFGVFQFGLLFAGIAAGLSPGIASVVLQLQVFFTILLSALINREKVTRPQAAGIALGFAGVILLATGSNGTISVLGVFLVAGAGLSWGISNVIAKNAGATDPLAFMIWSSAVPILPLIVLTFALEGYDSVAYSFSHLTWQSVGAVLYLVYLTTLFGYSVWNTLLRNNKTSVVAPLTLLVPVFGMIGSKIIFNEAFTVIGIAAAVLMILGLAVNQLGGVLFRGRVTRTEEPDQAASNPGRTPGRGRSAVNDR